MDSCSASGPALADLDARFGPNDVAVDGISADADEGAWRRYIGPPATRRLEIRDGDGGAGERSNINGRPAFVLLDRNGRVRWRQSGWTPFSYLVLRYRVGRLLAEDG